MPLARPWPTCSPRLPTAWKVPRPAAPRNSSMRALLLTLAAAPLSAGLVALAGSHARGNGSPLRPRDAASRLHAPVRCGLFDMFKESDAAKAAKEEAWKAQQEMLARRRNPAAMQEYQDEVQERRRDLMQEGAEPRTRTRTRTLTRNPTRAGGRRAQGISLHLPTSHHISPHLPCRRAPSSRRCRTTRMAATRSRRGSSCSARGRPSPDIGRYREM